MGFFTGKREDEMMLANIALIILLHGMTNPRSTEAFSIKRLSEGSAMVVAELLRHFFSDNKIKTQARYEELLAADSGNEELYFKN